MTVTADTAPADERVLILTPTGRDAALAQAALAEAGITGLVCPDMSALCTAFHDGAGAVLLAREALTNTAVNCLSESLSRQEPWSDLPLLVLASASTPGEHRSQKQPYDTLPGVTLLERPLRVATLISAVQAALRARRRQYEVRDHLLERTRAATERERLLQELEVALNRQSRIAEVLQRSLLSKPARDAFPGLDVDMVYQAARQEADIGGDFYDVFALGEGRVALAVGDVSGKGLTAASRTAEIKFALRAFLREYPFPARTLDRLNSFLLDTQTLDHQPTDTFIVLALAVLDTGTGALTLANAGAETPLQLTAAGDALPIQGNGPPLGVILEADYQETHLLLAPGDTVLLLTDGITEARRGVDFFGYDGFVTAARQQKASSGLDTLGQSILDEAMAFAGGPLSDDVCLLLARLLPK